VPLSDLPAAVVVVDLDAVDVATAPELAVGRPVVVVGTTADHDPGAHRLRAMCDLVLGAGDEALAQVVDTVGRNPLAATALVMLLRGSEGRPLDDGLLAESATYSLLQAGPEFAAWLAARPARDAQAEVEPVVVERHAGRLEITLNRPHVRNALNVAMRDALLDALAVAALDPSVDDVVLRGAGEGFCAGGDLAEFGSFPDPAVAHVVRLQTSIGRAIALLRDRVTVHLHGACLGSGIELPAFAGRVVAAPSTTIGLPEVGLGLVPGAGGTWSIPQRIGRWRTAQLALTGVRIPATTALEWGLVDEIRGG
jgi:1,4-dihydroxy-2-naphthoyl-CoA synthase